MIKIRFLVYMIGLSMDMTTKLTVCSIWCLDLFFVQISLSTAIYVQLRIT